MQKILFYLPFIKVGGLEKTSIRYMEALIKQGHKVDLIIDFNMGEEGNTFQSYIPKEISYQFIKSKQVSQFLYFFRTLGKKYSIFNIFLYTFQIFFDYYYYHKRVKTIIQQGNYDTTISFYQFLPAYLTQFEKITHIIWLHGSIEHFFTGIKSLFKDSYGRKLNKYDYIVTIAHEMQEQLKSEYPYIKQSKIRMLYNPFDFNRILTFANDISSLSMYEKILLNDDYICTVTRLDEEQKDLKTIILAYEKLYKKNNIKEKLYIIGDGPSGEMLKELVRKKGLQERINFLGKKKNPYIWMKYATIFVLSSKFEGLPTVLIEAMTVSTFTIASNCKTGPKEILVGGECGDLFEVGCVDELMRKLEFALSCKHYREEKIKKSFKRIKEFGNDISHIETLLNSKKNLSYSKNTQNDNMEIQK